MGHYMDGIREMRHTRCSDVRRGIRCDFEPNHAGYHMGVSKTNQRVVWKQKSVLKPRQRVVLRSGCSGYAVVQWAGYDSGGCAVALIRWKEGGHLSLADQRFLRRLKPRETV